MADALANVSVETMIGGETSGPVLQRLLANNMNPDCLRDNTVLRDRDWMEMDSVVVPIAKRRMRGIGDLITRGLTYNLTDAMGTPVLAYEQESDMDAATISMEAREEGYNDRATYTPAYLPIPLIYKEFVIGARNLAAARRMGHPLDTTHAAISTRLVSEAADNLLFNGSGTFVFNTKALQGYTNLTGRNTYTSMTAWTATAKTAALRFADIMEMKSTLQGDRMWGPYAVYVPQAYERYLDEDYSTYTGQTLRQRILSVEGIEVVAGSDWLATGSILMVNLQPETTRMVVGFQPRLVSWDSPSGMAAHFRCMAIMVPQLRLDKDGRSGIAHWSTS
jgi:uncharacterized linocin/CFP29 family protein